MGVELKRLGAGRACDGGRGRTRPPRVADLAAERHGRDLMAVAKPGTGRPGSKMAGSMDGASSAYTEAGPPERMSAEAFISRISSADMSQGNDLGIHIEVADATGNELTVLRTKVEYEDLLRKPFDPWYPLLLAGSRCPPA